MRYRLRTLLIVLALGPPVLAGAWFITRDLLTMTFLAIALASLLVVARSWQQPT